jgi:hypothetical protein
MTAGLAGASPVAGTNSVIELQRRAFGFGGAGATILLCIAVLGPIAAFLLCWDRAHGLVVAAAVLVPTPAVLVLQSLRGRANWAAQDVLGWLDRDAAAQWRDATATRVPRNSAQAGVWLASHRESDVPSGVWVTALLMAGRVDEARGRIARLPAETPAQLHRRLDLQLAADAADGRPIAAASADDAAAADSVAAPVTRAVHLAYHASVAAASHGGDGLPALAAARPALGRLPAGLTLQLYSIRFRFAAISALFGAWLLAAILVGMGTAGGAVWI